jgi:hypothetical protein
VKDRNGKAFKKGDWVLVERMELGTVHAMQVPQCAKTGVGQGNRKLLNMVALGSSEGAALRELLRLAGFVRVKGLFPHDYWRHPNGDLVEFDGPQLFRFVYAQGGWGGKLSTVTHLLQKLHMQGLGVRWDGDNTKMVEVPQAGPSAAEVQEAVNRLQANPGPSAAEVQEAVNRLQTELNSPQMQEALKELSES